MAAALQRKARMRRTLLVLILCSAVALPSFAAITGTVVNSDGQPVAGAKIMIYALQLPEQTRARLLSTTPERPTLASTTSDSKGKFAFESPKDPVVSLQIVANGYAPASFPIERDENRGTIALTAAETKQGRITAGGKPVAAAKVIWFANGEYLAITDTDGRYSVPDPSKWADRLVVIHPDYASVNEPTRRFMESAKVAVDRTLDAGVPLAGRVVAEDGKTPVSGATLSIDNWQAGTTGEDGSFAIAHAPKKWESLQARSGNLLGERSRSAKEPLVIKLGKAATISGVVRDVRTRVGIAGVEVRVRPSDRFDFTGSVAAAITDAKGAVTMTGVPPGSYDAISIRPGYSIPLASVNIAANDKAVKNFIATQVARVSGTVLDENKRPVAGSRVEGGAVSRESMMMMGPMRMGGAIDQTAISGPDGTFVVRLEPDADVQIHAMKKGYPIVRSSTMRLAPGERKSGLLLTIPLGFEVSGRVTDRNGNPLSAVSIASAESQPGGPSFFRQVNMAGPREEENLPKTGSDGRFSIRVKEGSYNFTFKREGLAAKTLRGQQINASTKPIDVTLDPSVEISGRVTRGGAGVEGVRIGVFGPDSRSSTETAPDGTFRITDLTPGQMMLNAIKPDEFIQQIQPVTAPASDVVIEIPPGGRIAGRVVDKQTRQPVTNFDAGVSAARGGGGMVFMGPPMSRHFTTDDGSFTLENVPPGQTNVVVNAAGYVAGRVSNVNVEEGKTVADVEVQMDHGVKVTGRVTGPDGTPLGGVSVRLDPGMGRIMRGSPISSTSAVTDANGDYTIEAVEGGEKTFAFTRSGYLPTEKTVTLSGSEGRVDAQLSSGIRVSGVVVTESGVPVADASVSASSASDMAGFGGRSTRTDSNGSFQMEGLAPGRYSFRAGKVGHATGMLKDVDVSSGAPIRITLKTGGTITGHVNGLTSDELQQVNVSASNVNGSASSPVDSAGNFRIEGAPAGTVRVSAVLSGGITGFRSAPAKSVEIEPGGTAQVDIDFIRNTIRGRVARDGKPAAQAMVMFSPQKGQSQTMVRTTTDSNGNYEATGLDDATYDVAVIDIQRGTPYTTTYEVRGSGTFNIDIQSAALRGRVLDASTGQPIEDAAVQIRPTSTVTVRFPLRTVGTDPSGGFTVDSVPPGSYSVSAEKEGYGTKVVDVSVGDSPADVELKLSPNPGVSLRVVDARDGRLISVFARVVDAQNKVVFESPMRFGSTGAEPVKLPLEAGSYRATIMAQGYATQVVTITSPSSPTVAMSPGGSIAIQSRGSALRRARLVSPDGREYPRGGFNPVFTIDPSPGTTVMENIAPGMYTLQILSAGDRVEASAPVSVVEGQRARVEI